MIIYEIWSYIRIWYLQGSVRICFLFFVRAKSENTKAFFIREEDIDSPQKFTEAYNTNPNLERCEDEKDKRIKELEREIKNIVWECSDTPGTKNYDEIVTRLELLSGKILTLVSKICLILLIHFF